VIWSLGAGGVLATVGDGLRKKERMMVDFLGVGNVQERCNGF
jgi:hypothetical protein